MEIDQVSGSSGGVDALEQIHGKTRSQQDGRLTPPRLRKSRDLKALGVEMGREDDNSYVLTSAFELAPLGSFCRGV
jgi:hypothetical protein